MELKSNFEERAKLPIACFYTGYTKLGVCYKNEPTIQKQYKLIEIEPGGVIKVKFDNGFMAYHPETLGELIVSVSGKDIVKSVGLTTRFHPRSQD